jgi:fatty acid desaturase
VPVAQRRAPAYVSTYAELTRQVRAAGLLGRAHGYYWTRISAALLGFVLVWVLVPVLGNSWFTLVPAVALAVVCAQLGFLGHDAAHRQVFASAGWNEWTARILSRVFAGLSYGWWQRKHNRHHSAPNQVGRDPDIASGVLALTPAMTQGRGPVGTWFVRHQGWWLYLLLLGEGVHLHVQGVRALLGRDRVRRRAVELAFLAVRLGGYPVVLLLVLSPVKALAFIAVQVCLFGVLVGAAFIPNHIGRPIVPAGARVDFLHRQVVMSRNVRGGLLVDFFMGGLNHQIEHHLFPSMARPYLRQARGLVRAHCAEHGVEYTETTLLAAYRNATGYLNAVGLTGLDPYACPLVRLYRG